MTKSPVFLDANALVYALDKTSLHHTHAVALIQKLLARKITLCTSHHVIEEVLHIAHKVSNTSAIKVIKEVKKIPNLVLIEPDASIEFAERYAALQDQQKMGVNDALLLQLMLDAGISRLFSYDKQFINRAASLGIKQIINPTK